jgi:hypothetical protein
MKKLSVGLLSMLSIVLAISSAFTVKSEDNLGSFTYHWYKNDDGGRPGAGDIVSNGIQLVQAIDGSGLPVSSFTEGGQTFQPAEFEDQYVPAVCLIPTTPICLILIRRFDGTNPTILIVIDGTYTHL